MSAYIDNELDDLENIKIKPLTKEQLIISIDRLTRFKDTETKYLRVFKDVLISNLISPKFKKSELDRLNYSELKILAEYIINSTLEQLGCGQDSDYSINEYRNITKFNYPITSQNPIVYDSTTLEFIDE